MSPIETPPALLANPFSAASGALLWVLAVAATLALVPVALSCLRAFTAIAVVWDFQSALHYRHGKLVGLLQAGRHRFWGRGHQIIVLDARIEELVVQSQELLSADGASVKLSAVAQWRIADPVKFYTYAADGRQALYSRVQLALREAVGVLELDALVERKSSLSAPLLEAVREKAASELGIEVLSVDLRDLMLSGELKAACAAVLGEKKAAQAKLEKARGDAAALRSLANAARLFEEHPGLLRLRYLDTIKEIGNGTGNQLVISIPEELLGLVNNRASPPTTADRSAASPKS